MTGRYVEVEGKRLHKLLFDTVRQAVRVIKRDPETSQWAKELFFSRLELDKIVHDVETSRHLYDDRDVYVIEGTNDGMPAMFELDIVHEERGDRRGHCVDVDLYSGGHHLEVSVCLPLPGDEDCTMLPFVNVRRISNR